MIFDSLNFVVFFACVLCLLALPLSWQAKKINLLIAGYFFYMAWNRKRLSNRVVALLDLV